MLNELGLKIMIVEDYQVLREVISEKFSKEGFAVVAAASGEEALAKLESFIPDVILLDVIMPGLNGFEVLQKIRENSDEKIAKTVIMMLSNLGDEEDVQKAMRLGADDYMIKSNFTISEIIEKIKRFF
ncbi:hypothetical protein A2331_06020 [Candidatus Falkowbacteria bacterium RIFOXYB2_FULL_34_18]|uniref:Response regulatory domain-containing protein n=1 Tax=Candidatus Falkowbacteria bacterium RIFOXYD2_FULL_34_120 TaxID=1798007 RepID=A0A1F5TQH0_9BACT|nr:MAG: hypothetical protein A2331_06020 [Candidatus Falkowbacteria bacterium RIFOXYB2_FULL_34_18]OGF29056.1 MAG: hypothetical protein A2500_03375 [Candidatus Falkowbacteria bacterium RIFOXYC12_FULL_34_55]OGF36134.1 MAG: hypothetical protein A2466_03595 [Candidatus Falkowbacteria bacterium RIFOXYC2_FULL_34_220]OGF38586.1 MAG: hypothetical protein A2515_04855 [Candidatus Falkowbacteria bacterium RIFOXYD12_FULL_34_57]OGF40741.1 MAG: hypothetical protein A2531_06900 [Candidatus Falkowbacteria bact